MFLRVKRFTPLRTFRKREIQLSESLTMWGTYKEGSRDTTIFPFVLRIIVFCCTLKTACDDIQGASMAD